MFMPIVLSVIIILIGVIALVAVGGNGGDGKTVQVVIPPDTPVATDMPVPTDTLEPTSDIAATVEAEGLANTPIPTAEVVEASPAAALSAAFVGQWGTEGSGDDHAAGLSARWKSCFLDQCFNARNLGYGRVAMVGRHEDVGIFGAAGFPQPLHQVA